MGETCPEGPAPLTPCQAHPIVCGTQRINTDRGPWLRPVPLFSPVPGSILPWQACVYGFQYADRHPTFQAQWYSGQQLSVPSRGQTWCRGLGRPQNAFRQGVQGIGQPECGLQEGCGQACPFGRRLLTPCEDVAGGGTEESLLKHRARGRWCCLSGLRAALGVVNGCGQRVLRPASFRKDNATDCASKHHGCK